jgi:hypothetical protein
MDPAGSDFSAAFGQSRWGAMSMLFAAMYRERQLGDLPTPRNDRDTMIRASVAGIAHNRSCHTMRSGQ